MVQTQLPRGRIALVLCALVCLAACGEAAQTGAVADSSGSVADISAGDLAGPEDATPADVEDAASVEDTAAMQDDTSTLPDLSGVDTTPPPDAGETSGEDGACSEAGCACTTNNQCNSGLCIEIDDGKQCATPCVSGCPEGFKCSQVSGSGGDIASICTPAAPRICEPCKSDSDCNNVLGGSGNRCVPYKDQAGSLLGNFCGVPCGTGSPCGAGYQCEELQSVDGIKSSQCVRQDLICPCDKRAKSLGLGTTCTSVNAIGSCGGKRSCSDTGLSACSAPAATAEQCNVVDDDCDGLTDEPSAGMCDDGTTCTYDNCIAGECQHPPKAGACDDGSACTSGDTCQNAVCVGSSVTCDDNNACTVDSCDVKTGCVHLGDDAATCSDGNACTDGDVCQKGACVPGKVVECDDKNPCTTDSCDAKTGCVNANNTLPCSDADVCTLIDVCAAGACVPGKVINCNDGNPCTDDTCDKVNACEHLTKPSACTDGNACTEGDACVDGFCTPGQQLDCDDKNPCTTDTCDFKTGCKHVQGSQPCDDGSVCTLGDACAAGVCIPGKAVSCDDGNPCTDDACDAATGCTHKANTAPCSDNNSCTLGDTCKAGACVPTQFSPCDDKNPCTTETCDPATGCEIAVNNAPCNDDSVCTTGDTCAGGLCVPGGLVNCDDKNPCTNDSCDSFNGCVHAANGAVCDDGNTCTFGDGCKAGACVGGPVQNCDDGNACTSDACDAALGCAYTPNTAPCSDNSVCTIGDVCKGGACMAGSAVSCVDGNPCTDDACDAAKGCVNPFNTAPCDDNNGCTTSDVCAAGTCKGAVGCSANGQCVPGALAPTCSCKAGYAGDGFTCADINECAVNNGGCDASAVCANTVGGFTCACKAGYTGDGKTCVDINECANNPCGANTTCTNTPGAFSCTCATGFADCNSNFALDGCEVNTQTSATNCGGCGNVCPAGKSCASGQCIQPQNFAKSYTSAGRTVYIYKSAKCVDLNTQTNFCQSQGLTWWAPKSQQDAQELVGQAYAIDNNHTWIQVYGLVTSNNTVGGYQITTDSGSCSDFNNSASSWGAFRKWACSFCQSSKYNNVSCCWDSGHAYDWFVCE